MLARSTIGLRSARRRRETYIGPWLPEPLVRAVRIVLNPEKLGRPAP